MGRRPAIRRTQSFRMPQPIGQTAAPRGSSVHYSVIRNGPAERLWVHHHEAGENATLPLVILSPSGGNRAVQGARRPVSRVLSTPSRAWDGHSSGTRLAARLTRPTRATGLEHPCVTAIGLPRTPPPAAPIRSCSRWGLPCRPRCRGRGALLPHRFTLAGGGLPPCAGGLFSVALSLGSPPPAVSRHRIPVEPGLSSNASGHPATSAAVRPSGALPMRAVAPRVKPDHARVRASARSRPKVPASAWPVTASPRQ